MNKKKLLINILKFIPFILGIILFNFKIYNVISSILLFGGGYVVAKNLLDYRQVNKNMLDIRNIPVYNYCNDKDDYKTIRHVKKRNHVRKRIK